MLTTQAAIAFFKNLIEGYGESFELVATEHRDDVIDVYFNYRGYLTHGEAFLVMGEIYGEY